MERDCSFCAIVAGKGEASVVYEDDAVVAFLDTLPISSGHTLIIPRRHATFLSELDPQDGARVFQAAQRLAAALRVSDLPCDGVNLLLNDGAEAGQRIFHSHLHVIPRTLNDNARFRRTEGPVPSREELDAVAEKIRAALSHRTTA